MKPFHKQLSKIIAENADYAIGQSETYADAIMLVKKIADQTHYGQLLRVAIQDEIVKRALNSKIKQ